MPPCPWGSSVTNRVTYNTSPNEVISTTCLTHTHTRSFTIFSMHASKWKKISILHLQSILYRKLWHRQMTKHTIDLFAYFISWISRSQMSNITHQGHGKQGRFCYLESPWEISRLQPPQPPRKATKFSQPTEMFLLSNFQHYLPVPNNLAWVQHQGSIPWHRYWPENFAPLFLHKY